MRINQLILKQPIYITLFGFFAHDLGKFISLFTDYENILRTFGLILIIIGLSRCKFKKPHQIPRYIRKFLFLYQIWLIILILGTIIRALIQYDSMPFDLAKILRYLAFFEHSPLIHLFPLVLRLDWDISLLHNYWRLGIFFLVLNGLLFFLYSSVLLNGLTYQGQTTFDSSTSETGYYDLRSLLPLIFVGTNFVSFRYNLLFYNKKLYLILLLLYSLLIYLLIIGGGSRGGLLMGLLVLLTPFVCNLGIVNRSIISVIGIVLIFISFNIIFNSEVGEHVANRLFEDKRELRLNESSREFYTESMLQDFSAKPWDFLFGRGAFGVYTLLNLNETRPDIEWGFLWFILKGGFVYLLLYLSFNSYVMYLGLFKSNNAFCRAIGYSSLVKIIALAPFGIPVFSLGLFIETMFTVLIFYSNFRNLNDQQIKVIFVSGK